MLVAAVNFKGSCVETTGPFHVKWSLKFWGGLVIYTPWKVVKILMVESLEMGEICNSRVLFMKLPSQALLWWFPHQLLQLIQRQNRMCPIDARFCTEEPEMGILTIIKPCEEKMWQENGGVFNRLNDIQSHLSSYFLSLASTNLPPSFPSIAPFPSISHQLPLSPPSFQGTTKLLMSRRSFFRQFCASRPLDRKERNNSTAP